MAAALPPYTVQTVYVLLKWTTKSHGTSWMLVILARALGATFCCSHEWAYFFSFFSVTWKPALFSALTTAKPSNSPSITASLEPTLAVSASTPSTDAIAFLIERLQPLVAARGDETVFLKGDRELPYGVVMEVLAILHDGGIQHVGMVTERKK